MFSNVPSSVGSPGTPVTAKRLKRSVDHAASAAIVRLLRAAEADADSDCLGRWHLSRWNRRTEDAECRSFWAQRDVLLQPERRKDGRGDVGRVNNDNTVTHSGWSLVKRRSTLPHLICHFCPSPEDCVLLCSTQVVLWGTGRRTSGGRWDYGLKSWLENVPKCTWRATFWSN